MVAARRFNQLQKSPVTAVLGIVTTGIQWRFLRLDGTRTSVDVVESPIQSWRSYPES